MRRKKSAQRVVTDQAAGDPRTTVEEHQQRRRRRQAVGGVEPTGQHLSGTLGRHGDLAGADIPGDRTGDQRTADVELPTPTLQRVGRCSACGELSEPQQELQIGIQLLTVPADRRTGKLPSDPRRAGSKDHPDSPFETIVRMLHRHRASIGVESGSSPSARTTTLESAGKVATSDERGAPDNLDPPGDRPSGRSGLPSPPGCAMTSALPARKSGSNRPSPISSSIGRRIARDQDDSLTPAGRVGPGRLDLGQWQRMRVDAESTGGDFPCQVG